PEISSTRGSSLATFGHHMMSNSDLAFMAYLVPVPIVVGWTLSRFYAAKREIGITFPAPLTAVFLYLGLYLLLYFLVALLIALFGLPVDDILGAISEDLREGIQKVFAGSPFVLPPLGFLAFIVWISSRDFWHHPNEQLLGQLLTVGHLKDDREALYEKLLNNDYKPSPS